MIDISQKLIGDLRHEIVPQRILVQYPRPTRICQYRPANRNLPTRKRHPGWASFLQCDDITASVFVNDDESGLHHDYEVWLEELAPQEPLGQYWHNRTGEDNADAHLKRQVMDGEVIVAIINGKLVFSSWEQIFYGEFNGWREKHVLESYQNARKIQENLWQWKRGSLPLLYEQELVFVTAISTMKTANTW